MYLRNRKWYIKKPIRNREMVNVGTQIIAEHFFETKQKNKNEYGLFNGLRKRT